MEDDETYSFSFQSDDQAISGIAPSSGEIILLDNDSKQEGGEKRLDIFPTVVAVIAFNQSIYEVSEELTPFSVCIELQNAVSINTNLTLRLQTEENTASTDDFESIINEERSVNGSTCYEISIISDDLLEDEEFFAISIDSKDTRLEINNPSAQIRIEDRNSKTPLILIARQSIVLFLATALICYSYLSDRLGKRLETQL